MNKKIFTLLAGVFLLGSGVANAQTFVEEYDSEKYTNYLIGNSNGHYLTVNAPEGEVPTLKLTTLPANPTLDFIQNALWQVNVEPGVNGAAPKITYINVGTGMPLNVSPEEAVIHNGGSAHIPSSAIRLYGTAQTWNNGAGVTGLNESALIAYFESAVKDSVVFFTANGTDLALAKDVANNALVNGSILKVRPYVANSMILNANDLLKLFNGKNSPSKYISLKFKEEINDLGNEFTDTALKPTDSGDGYVTLQAKNKKIKDEDGFERDAYVVVDTAFITGTENNNRLIAINYAAMSEENRLDESYSFQFKFWPSQNEIKIMVKDYITEPVDDDDAQENSVWGATVAANNKASITGAGTYVRIAVLTDKKVLTIGTDRDPVSGADHNPAIVKPSLSSGIELTTLEDGVYLIQYKTKGGDRSKLNDAYYITDLQGTSGGYRLAEKQDFNYVPSAQWVVEKMSTNSTSPVRITNREFNDWDRPIAQLYKTKDGNYYALGRLFRGMDSNDTINFIKVNADQLKDSTLGYLNTAKYSDDELKVKRFKFHYLSALNNNAFLSVPATKDSVIIASTTDATYFELERMVADDAYGYQSDEKLFPNLVRDVYRVKVNDPNKVSNNNKYVRYDETLNKFVTSDYKEDVDGSIDFAFFLKTYYVQGVEYYTLVKANLRNLYKSKLNPNTHMNEYHWVKHAVTDNVFPSGYLIKSGDSFYNYTANEWSSEEYGAYNASVNDANAYLNKGTLTQEFSWSNEHRVSGFAAVEADNDLYRRFNVEALGEKDNQNLFEFYSTTSHSEILYENNNQPNTSVTGINFLGFRNKQDIKADTILNGSLAGTQIDRDLFTYTLRVDSAYINRGTGPIKPQYLISVRTKDIEVKSENGCEPAGDSYSRGFYLVNTTDSARVNGAGVTSDIRDSKYIWERGWDRVAFVDAVRVKDTLYILNGHSAGKELTLESLRAAYATGKTNIEKVELGNNLHKDVVWQFRLTNDSNNDFLIETENRRPGEAATAIDPEDDESTADNVVIAPNYGGWIAIKNHVPVISRGNYTDAITQALHFNVRKSDASATSNDNINATEVKVVAGEGNVTIQNAAGKAVTISNILGQTVANTVLSSDNATIAAPKGIVVVAIDGEKAVKAIIK